VRIGTVATVGLSLVISLVPGTARLSAQGSDTVVVNAQRSMVTRKEIQAALDEIEKGLNSSAYSSALRSSKAQTAEVLRRRLTDGDMQPGDQIKLTVLGEAGLSDTFEVTPARTIVLPGNLEIRLNGILRSEVQQYLATQLKVYVHDPVVTATPYVRLQIFGAVGKPGFVNAPANQLLTQVITDFAGGPQNNAVLKKSQIRRNGRVVISGPEFQDAIFKARTLDQLNVQAGDEIFVATRPTSALIMRILAGVSGLGGLIYLAVRIL
jgi:protein involved in polysaccharide export with SLBB domain